MPFLSSAGSSRQCVLLCARLLVQCVVGWSTPQAGIDDLMSLRFADGTSGSSTAREGWELIAPICVNR